MNESNYRREFFLPFLKGYFKHFGGADRILGNAEEEPSDPNRNSPIHKSGLGTIFWPNPFPHPAVPPCPFLSLYVSVFPAISVQVFHFEASFEEHSFPNWPFSAITASETEQVEYLQNGKEGRHSEVTFGSSHNYTIKLLLSSDIILFNILKR